MKHTLLGAIVVAASVGLAATAYAAGDAQAGKAKAVVCAGCHGPEGQGVTPNPALAGLGEDRIVQALQDYKSGKRANPIMKSLATPLSEQDMANLAAYYASLKK